MFFLETLSRQLYYRLSFQAGQTVDRIDGYREQRGLFKIFTGIKFHFLETEVYSQETVQIYSIHDRVV